MIGNKKMNLVLSLTLLSVSLSAFASNKVIYGIDNRVDVFESTSSKFVKLSKSTAAMVLNYKIKPINSYEVELSGMTLEDSGVCKSEKFSQQPTVANCSGFLVDKNKLVTAGHCIEDATDCANNSWVFDYKVDYSDQGKVIVDKSKVYKCKKIISRDLNTTTKNDYALIELEEVVTDREPLKFRKTGKAKVGDKLVVIGHPSGLPSKIADGAKIRSTGSVFFNANLDTYGGNSGSAVFNATTGVIEGILVRGDQDYKWDSALGCKVSNVIASDAGRGEDVTLITNIKELASISSGTQAPPKPDYSHLPAWLRRWLGL